MYETDSKKSLCYKNILESPSVLIFPKGSDMLEREKEERKSLVDKLYKLNIGTVLCCMVL